MYYIYTELFQITRKTKNTSMPSKFLIRYASWYDFRHEELFHLIPYLVLNLDLLSNITLVTDNMTRGNVSEEQSSSPPRPSLTANNRKGSITSAATSSRWRLRESLNSVSDLCSTSLRGIFKQIN